MPPNVNDKDLYEVAILIEFHDLMDLKCIQGLKVIGMIHYLTFLEVYYVMPGSDFQGRIAA